MPTFSNPATSDVLVVGRGLIGLACAISAAERGFSVRVVGGWEAGEASLAAAGMLAPSIDRDEGPAHDFAVAARDRYPLYLEWLRERTGIEVPLNRDGIIQVAISDRGVRGLQRSMPSEARWLDARELAALEPALGHGRGAVLHPLDGAVDNVRLHEALHAVATSHPRISLVSDTIRQLAFARHVTAVGAGGTSYDAAQVVLAAGAWSGGVIGLPRTLPVEPVRGQMLAYRASPLTRVVYGPTGYVVPRADGRTLVGATAERVGYDSGTTPAGVDRLRRTAAEILPSFAELDPSEAWAGLRPMSSDLQPILGPDPEEPRLIYATGHSRNGVLMTPLTGDCIGALLTGDAPPVDWSAFRIDRFA